MGGMTTISNRKNYGKMEINILTNYQLIVIMIMVMQMENKQISSKEQVENFLYFISFCEISGE